MKKSSFSKAKGILNIELLKIIKLVLFNFIFMEYYRIYEIFKSIYKNYKYN